MIHWQPRGCYIRGTHGNASVSGHLVSETVRVDMVRFSLLKSRLYDRLPGHSSAQENEGPKTVNIFVIFFFLVNFQLATGFLGIPFAFFHGGLLAVGLGLIAASFINWNMAMCVLETMARAQVCVY